MNAYVLPGLTRQRPPFPTMESISLSTTRLAGVNILLPTRKQEIVLPRQVAMCLATIFTTLSRAEIGKYYMKDHATTTHARNHVLGLVEMKDAEVIDLFAPMFHELKDVIEGIREVPGLLVLEEKVELEKILKRIDDKDVVKILTNIGINRPQAN